MLMLPQGLTKWYTPLPQGLTQWTLRDAAFAGGFRIFRTQGLGAKTLREEKGLEAKTLREE